MVWASRWSVALRTFYRQILSLLYIVFFLLKLPPPARPGTTCKRFAEIKRGWCELEVEVDPEEKEPTAEDFAKIVPFEWPDSD